MVEKIEMSEERVRSVALTFVRETVAEEREMKDVSDIGESGVAVIDAVPEIREINGKGTVDAEVLEKVIEVMVRDEVEEMRAVADVEGKANVMEEMMVSCAVMAVEGRVVKVRVEGEDEVRVTSVRSSCCDSLVLPVSLMVLLEAASLERDM